MIWVRFFKISIRKMKNFRFNTASLFGMSSLLIFIYGIYKKMFVGGNAIDIPLHDTYFVIPEFDALLLVVLIFGFFSVVYFLFPKNFGRYMNEKLGKIHFSIVALSVFLITGAFPNFHWAGEDHHYAAEAYKYSFVKEYLFVLSLF